MICKYENNYIIFNKKKLRLKSLINSLNIKITNSLKELVPMYDQIKEFCIVNRFLDYIRYDVNLIIEELVTNTISYGYIDENVHEIEIKLVLKDDSLYVDIINDADTFNPLNHPDPDFSVPSNQRQPGGLGIYFAKILADEISYNRKDEHNYISFKKSLKK
jgi:serine/threonine-protein kinase RsbW